ncbi:nuclease-related domain-containing protein [Deinococcus alpinitundrae]|uniref:nuclease-related domain-containing protein n=1 Tax=Deinococcus alpinitundrae TaxID=468913 RepID=UPI00137B62AE|nr:nuclease-related domain-containing protein [Deinococcus alpinitundrae]
MIVKTHDAQPTQDKFQRAGDEAEKQMAFYLKRAFGENPDVHVFHNLRFEHGGDVAQIDHLVFHRSGFIIIESKSVTSTVRINEREEWSRQWNGEWRGMPSPILQARRQADLLRSFLQAHKEELRGKVLLGLKQATFAAFMIDVVVAISDQGVVQHQGALPDVRKADQVPDRIKELIADHVQLAHPFSRDKRSKDWGVNLPAEEFTRTSAFLRAKHCERRPVQTEASKKESLPAAKREAQAQAAATSSRPQSAASSSKLPAFSCRACKSTSLEITFGRSYYFKCKSCDGNTPIQLSCPKCKGQQRTRKSGKQFFAECAACQSSELYFTNA